MAPDPIRFLKSRDTRGMAAPDTIDAIIYRVQALLSHERRMTLMQRYTHQDAAPTVVAGLTVARMDKPINTWKNDTDAGISVQLDPGINSFGISTAAAWDATEKAAWARYHRANADKRYKGPENFTEVIFRGGLPGDGPARDDQLTINAWNSAGVCMQTTIAFDYDGGMPRRDDPVAAWLKANRDLHKNGTSDSADAIHAALDEMLDEYRDHADAGTPLGQEIKGPHWGSD